MICPYCKKEMKKGSIFARCIDCGFTKEIIYAGLE